MTVSRREWWLLVALVVVHAVVSGGHGLAHLELPVRLAAWQQLFVLLVPMLAPFVALYAVRRGHERVGATLLTLSMAAALLFGLTFHYLLPNPDNVAAVPAGFWGTQFSWTAAAIAGTELAGAVAGAWLWFRVRGQPPAGTAA